MKQKAVEQHVDRNESPSAGGLHRKLLMIRRQAITNLGSIEAWNEHSQYPLVVERLVEIGKKNYAKQAVECWHDYRGDKEGWGISGWRETQRTAPILVEALNSETGMRKLRGEFLNLVQNRRELWLFSVQGPSV